MTAPTPQPGPPAAPRQRTILVVDDDQIFRTRLVRALQSRGYEVLGAASGGEGIELARRSKPGKAVVDLRMPGMNGLDLVNELAKIDPDMQILVLTGYGSIATAVEAVRRGALDYLTKPADTDQILSRFEHDGPPPTPTAAVVEQTPSLARVEWEHIQRTLEDCDGNISQAARKLGIHRRSLQRKLGKLPPLE
jgi:two-component system, response regulator RegA